MSIVIRVQEAEGREPVEGEIWKVHSEGIIIGFRFPGRRGEVRLDMRWRRGQCYGAAG